MFDNDGMLVGVAKTDTVYTVDGSEDATYHTVAYLNNVPAKFKLKSAAVVGNKTYIYSSNNATVTVG